MLALSPAYDIRWCYGSPPILRSANPKPYFLHMCVHSLGPGPLHLARAAHDMQNSGLIIEFGRAPLFHQKETFGHARTS